MYSFHVILRTGVSMGAGAWAALRIYSLLSLLSRLAQLVERKTLNLVVVGSSPTVGVLFAFFLPPFV